MKAIFTSQKKGLRHKTDICLLATSLKKGSVSCTNSNANANEKKTVNKDSLKNRMSNCLREEPTVLRLPTSLARLSLRAVLRFIKLIQASNNTNIPIIP